MRLFLPTALAHRLDDAGEEPHEGRRLLHAEPARLRVTGGVAERSKGKRTREKRKQIEKPLLVSVAYQIGVGVHTQQDG